MGDDHPGGVDPNAFPPDRKLSGTCLKCGQRGDWTLFWKLKVIPVGNISAAGFSARTTPWPYLRCESCGHVSEGR